MVLYKYIMIKVFIYENYNELSGYFQEEDYNIPFLGSTLFDFVLDSYSGFADLCGQEVEFYCPHSWDDLGVSKYSNLIDELSEDLNLVILTDLFSLPLTELSKDDYFFFTQNPNKLFSHSSGLKAGYISKSTNLSTIYGSEDLKAFSGVAQLTEKNFLMLNRMLVSQINFEGVRINGSYGNPTVLCSPDSIINSTICGPCFIGDDVHIVNSTIYPGTILTGKTTIQNSEIFESFLCASKVSDSTVKNSLVVLSDFEGLNLKNSILPRGSFINNVRNR